MTLEIHLMRDQPHSEGLLMVYVPKSKLLIQADAYIPRPGAPPLPAPSPYTTNLVENISRLKLDVERVVQIHGGSSAVQPTCSPPRDGRFRRIRRAIGRVQREPLTLSRSTTEVTPAVSRAS